MKKILTMLKNVLFLLGINKTYKIEYIISDFDSKQFSRVSEFFTLSQIDFKKHLKNLKKDQRIKDITIKYEVSVMSKTVTPL